LIHICVALYVLDATLKRYSNKEQNIVDFAGVVKRNSRHVYWETRNLLISNKYK